MPQITKPAQRDPIGPFLHYLMAECGVSPHTLAAYRSDLMRFVRWRKSKPPVDAGEPGCPRSGRIRRVAASRRAWRRAVSAGTWPAFRRSSASWSSRAGCRKTWPSCWSPRRSGTACRPCSVPRPSSALLESPSPLTRLGRRDRAALETFTRPAAAPRKSSGSGPSTWTSPVGNGPMHRQGEQGATCPAGSQRHRRP